MSVRPSNCRSLCLSVSLSLTVCLSICLLSLYASPLSLFTLHPSFFAPPILTPFIPLSLSLGVCYINFSLSKTRPSTLSLFFVSLSFSDESLPTLSRCSSTLCQQRVTKGRGERARRRICYTLNPSFFISVSFSPSILFSSVPPPLPLSLEEGGDRVTKIKGLLLFISYSFLLLLFLLPISSSPRSSPPPSPSIHPFPSLLRLLSPPFP